MFVSTRPVCLIEACTLRFLEPILRLNSILLSRYDNLYRDSEGLYTKVKNQILHEDFTNPNHTWVNLSDRGVKTL